MQFKDYFKISKANTLVTVFKYIFKWLCITAVIGICVGTASAGFLISLDWVTSYRQENLWLLALLPFGGFLIGLLYHYYGKNVVLGNALLIDAIHNPLRNRIPFRMAPFVYIGTIVTHFLGGSAGREGTALQMAGAISDQFHKLFKLNSEERSILIIAAIAAGFGSVFGTPLAGAVFALEVFLIGRIRYNAVFPAFIAAIIADMIANLWSAPHTHYHIDSIPEFSLVTILYSIIAGIIFGLCAVLFTKLMHKITALFALKIKYPPLRPFFGGIVIVLAVLIIGSTKYMGLGIPTILASFEEQLPTHDFMLKLLFTVVTLSAGFKGGEVTPLFFIGATLGNAVAYFLPLPLGLLSGMGFVAVFAGATNAPLACIIMAIELFGVASGVYVTIACLIAYLVSGNTSIYNHHKDKEAKYIILRNYIVTKIKNL